MEAFLDSVTAWSWLVYLIIFLVVLIESMGAPIPALTMALAGAALAGQGKLAFGLVYLAAIAGGIAGGWLGYQIGRRGGRPLLERYGRYIKLTPARIAQGELLCQRHGGKALLFSRYLPVLCFAGGLLSGLSQIAPRRFFLYNALSITLWATTQLTLGFIFGRSLDVLLNLLNQVGLVFILILIACAAAFFAWRRRATA